MAATYRRISMKALARYQIILLGEQRHIGVNNLPKVVARQCISILIDIYFFKLYSKFLAEISQLTTYGHDTLCSWTLKDVV